MIRWSKTDNGIASSNGKYFIGVNGRLGGSHLNWVLYDLRDSTYQDGFHYQRDAKAFAETLVSRGIESRGKKVRQSYYQTLLKRLRKS